jgi:signal transduction histidine kinase/ligand-binding sensor domain-containing protein/DNA-binding response OmpR family regulator
MKFRRAITSFWILLTTVAFSHAQSGNYKFTRIDVNKGLSHNQVNCLFKDSRGYMWFGTASGLNRFNGYNMKVYRNDPRDSSSLPDNQINSLFEDPDGRLWINESGIFLHHSDKFARNTAPFLKAYNVQPGLIHTIIRGKDSTFWFVHGTLGLYRYDKATRTTKSYRNIPGDDTSIASDRISTVAESADGGLWIIHLNGVLEKMDVATGRIIFRNRVLQKQFKNAQLDYQFSISSDGKLWMFTSNGPNGVFVYHPVNDSFAFINTASPGLKLNTNIVRGITEDNEGAIWIGTDHGGVNVVGKDRKSIQYLVYADEDSRSLGQNSITCMHQDDEGIIWLGTYKKGVSYYHENIVRFPLYRHTVNDPRTISYEDVNRFVEDDLGNLWIGTNGGGLIYFDRTKNSFTQYKHDPADDASLGSDVIVSLFIDHQKQLWIGTYYGGLNRFDGKRFHHYKNDPLNPASISDENVWEIFEDSQNNLWIGTLYKGLDLYDTRTQTFRHYRKGDVNSIASNYVSAMLEDRDGNLWIGTDNGIDMLDRQSGRFRHFGMALNTPGTLSNNLILYLHEDELGLIWVATREGLNIFNPATAEFSVLSQEHGLPHNTILTILQDDRQTYWISTPSGLANLTIDKKDPLNFSRYSIKTYDESDGLQGMQFNENAACKTSKGELVFGGAYGFNIFKPDDLGNNVTSPKIVFTDFLLFNKSVSVGEEAGDHVVLTSTISETKEITLPHSENVFSIEFATLSYLHPEKNKYLYKLEGFNNTWVQADATSRKATYTNLDPGNYTFRVRASNNDGVWNNEGISLVIHILPPFWATPWAIVLYVSVLVGALYVSRRVALNRVRTRFRIEQERKEAQHLHELDAMKIKFLTNVSHEFRTPLTLILTPLEKIIKTTTDRDSLNQFHMIQRNAKRLLNLVNKLLDFRKLEVDEVKFNPSEGDIISFIKDTVYSFSDLSDKKEIALNFKTTLASLETIFDQDKLEKILFNLLSNAFKFTPEHGNVSVELERVSRGEKTCLRIVVSDSGIGIAPDKLDKIFERFYQAELPEHIVNQGSGIGLSITKEFVKIHEGTIIAESEPGKGSTFIVELPVYEVRQTFSEDIFPARMQEVDNTLEEIQAHNLPSLLLIEDNGDFRYYLRDNLKTLYRIYEAKDGKEGLAKTLSLLPDLIVSDVMMPGMDGIELCRKIKNDSRVSHIPVVLLTARSKEEQKLEGLECGADDYITKPFSFDILQLRIKRLIQKQEQFHRDFNKFIEVKASDIKITSLDENLIRKAIECVENNISDADFSVEDLSRELGMSRVHLYKKLLALTGKSPLEFIRSIRLQRAAQLLEKSQLSVAEVAYQVGFNNPKYFARYFKEAFNMLPSAYQASKS